MRFALILFASYAFVSWNDAHAGSNECLQGVRSWQSWQVDWIAEEYIRRECVK